ncbi:RhuM family protein [Draconibacterium sp. IB214405]|uniref:virulence RhuM family protein n=1 Tax=Draconibacterium sp. IB214405 TaxID=3097352 RepID=UPI002A10A10F|nr:RhuM family protein [Draconibacterium sp. IB214405]MDX8339742.1 RhuM family protein [Draconibacterium sp. IB214405]
MQAKNEIIIYQPDASIKVEVKIEDETVWLTQEQMADLFGRNRVAITQHIGNIFKEGELHKEVVCKDFLLTTQHGAIEGKTQTRKIKIYNLDVIISVGYRVKSKQGTQFRIWANKILKDYLLKGYSLNTRMNRIEDNVQALNEKVNQIDLQLHTSLPPKHGIFFNGEVYDAYTYVSDIFRSAKKAIIIIDNYIDDSVLTLLLKRNEGVSANIYTKNIDKTLKLDLKKHNEQYDKINMKQFNNSHDRFIIIDYTELYHFGASLKDLGKKWFAFSRMDTMVTDVLNKLNEHEK